MSHSKNNWINRPVIPSRIPVNRKSNKLEKNPAVLTKRRRLQIRLPTWNRTLRRLFVFKGNAYVRLN